MKVGFLKNVFSCFLVKFSKFKKILNFSKVKSPFSDSLLRLSVDLNDDIRRDVVTGVTEVAKTKLEVISDKMLKACAERMKDKKVFYIKKSN